MSSLWRSFQELLPIAAVLAVAMSLTLWWWWRLTNVGRHHLARRLAGVVLLAWAVGALLVTLRPRPAMISSSGQILTRQLDLVPGREIWAAASDTVSSRVFLEEVVGNVILFVPLGIAIAMATLRTRQRVFGLGLLAGTLIGSLIESLQWILGTGRVSSLDDVALAACGTVAGLAAGRIALRFVLLRSQAALGHGADASARPADRDIGDRLGR